MSSLRPGWSIALAILFTGAVGVLAGRAAEPARACIPPAIGSESQPVAHERVTDTLRVDLDRSAVRWRGTKFRGRGKHEGTVAISSGMLALCGAQVCGGRFVLDMQRIAVTDIPPHESVARARLTSHLRSRDFFWTERYPAATFVLQRVTRDADRRHRVSGTLTMRGVTRTLAFPASLDARTTAGRRVTARFRIDRQDWGVAYRFDPVRNEIIDDDIQLELEMVFPP